MTTQEQQATNAAVANDCEAWIKKFQDSAGRKPYLEQMDTMLVASQGKEAAVFTIWHQDLPDNLAVLLLHKPDETLEALKDGVLSVQRERHSDFEKWLRSHLEIEIYEVPPSRRLDRTLLNKFVALGPCQVHRIEPVRQLKTKTAYRCTNCSCVMEAKLVGGVFLTPKKCTACSEKHLKEDQEAIELQDQRYIEVIMAGENGLATEKAPKYWLDLLGEKAHVEPDFGEPWIVSGIIRLSEDKEEGPVSDRTTHFLYLEVNSIQKVAKEEGQIVATPEMMVARKLWVAKCNKEGKIIEVELVGKLAPWIVGEGLLKTTLLWQAVSGCVTNMADHSAIHVLIMRNPGKAKTKLALAMARLTGGGYFTGTGVSSVGLVVGLETDPRTKQKVAKAGMAILYNGKPKYYDEVDKTPDKEEVLAELNSPMEEEFYTETKILNQKFITKGPWCLLGNFRNRKYYPKGSLYWNIALPSDLMDRFDIWHIEPSSTYDKEQEDDILDAQSDKFERGDEIMQDDQELREHIACARSITKVTFEPGIREIFKNFYHDMKKLEQAMDGGSMFERRQFNGLYRLAVARAVLHLRDVVTKEDADAAVKHLTAVIAKVGIDSTTSMVDLGILTGDHKSRQNRLKVFKPIMAQIQGGRHEDVSEEVLLKQLVASGAYKDLAEAKSVLQEAREARMVMVTRPGYLRLV